MKLQILGAGLSGQKHLLLEILAEAAEGEPCDHPHNERIAPGFDLHFQHVGKPARGALSLAGGFRN